MINDNNQTLIMMLSKGQRCLWKIYICTTLNGANKQIKKALGLFSIHVMDKAAWLHVLFQELLTVFIYSYQLRGRKTK